MLVISILNFIIFEFFLFAVSLACHQEQAQKPMLSVSAILDFGKRKENLKKMVINHPKSPEPHIYVNTGLKENWQR